MDSVFGGFCKVIWTSVQGSWVGLLFSATFSVGSSFTEATITGSAVAEAKLMKTTGKFSLVKKD